MTLAKNSFIILQLTIFIFCKHNYRYTQGHFYCTKCGHRSYNEYISQRSSNKKWIILGIIGVVIVGIVMFASQIDLDYFPKIQQEKNEESSTFSASEDFDVEKSDCIMASNGLGDIIVNCPGGENYDCKSSSPAKSNVQRAGITQDVTLRLADKTCQISYIDTTGKEITKSFILLPEVSQKSNKKETEKPPIIEPTIITKTVKEIKETIEKNIPKEPIDLPKNTLGKPEINISELEQKIHYLINRERQQNNLSALVWDTTISEIARSHSQDMANRNYFAHDTPDGISPSQRGFQYGYHECGDRSTIELSHKYEQLSRQFTASGSTNQMMYQQLQSMYYQLNASHGKIFLGLAENIMQNNLYDRVWYTNGIPTSYEWNDMDELAESTVQGWMDSPGHRQNILTPYFYSEGIGVSISSDDKVYVTQNFC